MDIHNPWRESLENCAIGDNYLRSNEYHELADFIDMQLARIAELEARQVPEWISVELQQPAEGGRYLAYVEEVTDLGISHYVWNASFSPVFGFIDTHSGGRVTHWMPLPAAPLPADSGEVKP